MLATASQPSPQLRFRSAGSFATIVPTPVPETPLFSSLSARHSAFDRSTAKPNLQGLWQGQAFGVGTPDNFKIRLKSQGGSKFTGRAEARNSANPGLFLVTALQGKIVDGALLLKQTRILQDNFPPNLSPCLRSGRLSISVVKGKISLQGPWLSNQPGCGASRIRLRKQ